MLFKNKFWNIKNIIFVVLAIVLLLILPKIVGILMLFFSAYVIACALNPYVTKLLKRMNRTLAASLVMFVCFLSLIALFLPIFIVAFKEIRVFMLTLPEKAMNALTFVLNFNIYGHRMKDLLDINSILGNSSAFAQGIFSQSLNVTIGIAQVIVLLIVLTMLIYYILCDKDYLKSKFLEFFPPDLKDKAENILYTISLKVGSYVRAQLISMAAVGAMVLIVLIILGVDYATLLALISGILDIIPILGPSIALLIILTVASPMSLLKLVLIVCGFLLCQQISNYVIKPVLFGKLMKMHPLMIFLALFMANQFLGFWGIILSPAIASTVCVLIDELYLKPINIKGSGNNE